MKPLHLPQLDQLAALRGNPLIVYSAMIDDNAARTLYDCLRTIGPVQRLDLVLSTMGGAVTTARRMALLLRECTEHLTILVPYRARSAGTLLCLSANELVLGPMAELGPIDPQISSAGPPPPDAPGMISAEDIRAFRQMAEEWFGVTREKDRLQVLALLAQRMFPISLSSFYRSDRLTRQAALELLRYQLPEAEEAARLRIVNQLVGGYDAHNHIITRADAQALGLRARFTSAREEALLWDLAQTCRQHYLDQPGLPGVEGVIGLIVSPRFCARLVQRWVEIPELLDARGHDSAGLHPQKIPQAGWEIDEQRTAEQF